MDPAELVIRAEIGGWTRDGIVRQTSFKGLERDRDPREVVRERAVDPAKADREAAARSPHLTRRYDRWRHEGRPAASTRPWIASDAELETLATLKAEGIWAVAGQELKLTNLDKVAVPAAATASTSRPSRSAT